MRHLKVVFFAFLVPLASSFALGASPAFADPPDAFLKDAIRGNIAEVKMGELAQKKGASEGVKSFGKMLASDHGKARDKTMKLAKTLNVTAPTEPSSEAKAVYDKLERLNGFAFCASSEHLRQMWA